MSDLCTREAYQVIVEYFANDKPAWYSPVEHGDPARKLYADYAIRMLEDGIKAVYLTRDGVVVALSRY